ncbi:MAG: hypothetical protein RI967_2074, partial [Planctomycetota bacterium]
VDGIPKRALAAPVVVRVPSAGGESRCEVSAWDGEVLIGSIGVVPWRAMTAGEALAILRTIVPKEDAAAVADAIAVVVSHPDPGRAVATAVEWGRRCGLDRAALDAARARGEALRVAREERLAKERAARLVAASPEAAAFPAAGWLAPARPAFDKTSAELVESARAALAKAGASATLHEAPAVALLVERDEESARADAAFLERFAADWIQRFERAGVETSPQARIVVVAPADRDRWRLLVVAAFGGDPDRLGSVVTVYPTVAPGGDPLAMVLVAPEADPTRRRFAAALGVARAVCHYAGSPLRGPAWLNEGLPRVMADLAVPEAKMDLALRRDGLAAIRAGGDFAALLGAEYIDPPWEGDRALATSLSYMFVRWLYENRADRLIAFAEPVTSAGPAPSPVAPWPERFRRAFGMTPAEASARAKAWFTTND